MRPALAEQIALTLAGLTALGIGAFILLAPQAFHAGYGIAPVRDPSLLSEMRAPAAALAALGALMLLGLRRRAMMPVSVAAALTVYLAFPAGRLVGLAVDGMPTPGILGALVIELAIATLCLFAFRRRLGFTGSGATRTTP